MIRKRYKAAGFLFLLMLACGSGRADAEQVMQDPAAETVYAEMEGPESVLVIDAEVPRPAQVWEGTLKVSPVPEGFPACLPVDADRWQKEEGTEGEVWRYGDTPLIAAALSDQETDSRLSYGIENTKAEEEVLELIVELPEMEPDAFLQAAELPLGVDCFIGAEEQALSGQGGQELPETSVCYYRVTGLVEGEKMAWYSPESASGILLTANGRVIGLDVAHISEVEEKQEAEIVPFEAILEKLKLYMENGFLNLPSGGLRINQILLQYYVERTDRLLFYPVWVFRVLDETGGGTAADVWYLDARTSELIFNRGVF